MESTCLGVEVAYENAESEFLGLVFKDIQHRTFLVGHIVLFERRMEKISYGLVLEVLGASCTQHEYESLVRGKDYA
jgi:hypothetical protein